jgi:hypothetical protein
MAISTIIIIIIIIIILIIIIIIIIIIIVVIIVAGVVVRAGTVQSVERFGYELEDQRIANHFHRQSRPYRSPPLQSGGY